MVGRVSTEPALSDASKSPSKARSSSRSKAPPPWDERTSSDGKSRSSSRPKSSGSRCWAILLLFRVPAPRSILHRGRDLAAAGLFIGLGRGRFALAILVELRSAAPGVGRGHDLGRPDVARVGDLSRQVGGERAAEILLAVVLPRGRQVGRADVTLVHHG